jgi:hypothetical protein
VRLEVELLASEQPVERPTPTVGDRRQPHTVLVVIGDDDVRRYVREFSGEDLEALIDELLP